MSQLYEFFATRIASSQWTLLAVSVVGIYLLTRAVSYLLAYIKFVKQINRIPGPPVPAPYVLGNLYVLRKNHNARSHGSVVAFAESLWAFTKFFPNNFVRIWLSYKPMLCVADAQSAEVFFTGTNHIEKAIEYRFLQPWLGTGLLTSNGNKWFTRRKMLTPAFHFNILEGFLVSMNEQSNVMVRLINEKIDAEPNGTAELDVVDIFTHCALDIICETAMGTQINSQENPNSDYVKAIHELGANIIKRLLRPWLWNNFVYFNLSCDGRQDAKHLKILHNFTEQVIHKRKLETIQNLKMKESQTETVDDFISKKRRLAFLDLLIEQHLKDPKNLSELDIREEVDTFMFEGHDTTAMSLTWTLFLLGHHPEVQQRVYDEISQVLGADPKDPDTIDLTTEKLRNLKYLEACIKESLRLYPSVPFVARITSNPIEYKGLTVPLGTTVLILILSIQRDAKHFPKPNNFIPERFVEGSEHFSRSPFAYVPFSAGARNCIGQKFALQEEKVLLAKMLRNFEVKTVKHPDNILTLPELVMRPKESIMVRFSRRKY